jgi:hypothetical protein
MGGLKHITRLYSGSSAYYDGRSGSCIGSYKGKIRCSLMTFEGVLLI